MDLNMIGYMLDPVSSLKHGLMIGAAGAAMHVIGLNDAIANFISQYANQIIPYSFQGPVMVGISTATTVVLFDMAWHWYSAKSAPKHKTGLKM